MRAREPPFFGPIAELVVQAFPRSSTHTFEGAGHVPHISHPQQYVETVRQVCESSAREFLGAKDLAQLDRHGGHELVEGAVGRRFVGAPA